MIIAPNADELCERGGKECFEMMVLIEKICRIATRKKRAKEKDNAQVTAAQTEKVSVSVNGRNL